MTSSREGSSLLVTTAAAPNSFVLIMTTYKDQGGFPV